MSNSRDNNSDPREKAVGCLFSLMGGFLGVAIGVMASWVLEPIVFKMYHQPGNKLSGMFEVGFASLAIIVSGGLTGLIAFSYFELKRRK